MIVKNEQNHESILYRYISTIACSYYYVHSKKYIHSVADFGNPFRRFAIADLLTYSWRWLSAKFEVCRILAEKARFPSADLKKFWKMFRIL